MERFNYNCITVTQFNTYLKNILIAEEMLQNVFLIGEVEDFKIKNGAAFFTVKDGNCGMSCTAFDINKQYIPKNGELVILRGYADFYFKAGRISFRVLEIIPAGAGLLNKEFELLKKRLSDAGYFEESHKKQLPTYAFNVAIITSLSGAVVHDFITTARKKNEITDIFAYEARVQGVNAAQSIASALKRADARGHDVIVIARGGGSSDDLSAFNDERLVKAIYEAKTPVVSAVGHETDVTLCDMAADRRSPTPTAAAELVIFDAEDLNNKLNGLRKRFVSVIEESLSDSARSLTFFAERLISQAENKLAIYGTAMKVLLESAERSVNAKLENAARTLEYKLLALDKNNPARILSTGYFKLYKQNLPVNELKTLKKSDVITVFDGKTTAEAQILEIKTEEERK